MLVLPFSVFASSSPLFLILLPHLLILLLLFLHLLLPTFFLFLGAVLPALLLTPCLLPFPLMKKQEQEREQTQE